MHLTTPMKSNSNSITPCKLPLSTSDPSCYGTEATPTLQPSQNTPFGLMATPAAMITGSCSVAGRADPNILGLPRSAAKPGPYVGSGMKYGRSPFVNRQRTPHPDSAKYFKVRF